ncbi:MAG: DUF2339 domain-containing protein [Myxococcota bacterium]
MVPETPRAPSLDAQPVLTPDGTVIPASVASPPVAMNPAAGASLPVGATIASPAGAVPSHAPSLAAQPRPPASAVAASGGALPASGPRPRFAPSPSLHGDRDHSAPLWWQVGGLQSVSPERFPIVALAAAGGLAVLAGMLFFVWYAVDQGWLSPTTRLMLGGIAGLAAIVGAWPLARRHPSAAGGLGGAGLGTWFVVWTVARHVHDVVGATTTFAGLASAALLCLVVAGHRHLRLMAVLGALAAFATPLAASTGADRLHELMLYQLVIMGALVALERIRRWPELGHMALVGTGLLMAGWAGDHLNAGSHDRLLGWSLTLLVAVTAQTVQLRMTGFSSAHAALRQLAGGLFVWSLVGAAAWDRPELLAGLTLGMGLWHLALAAWSTRRGEGGGLDTVALGLGWAQLFAFGPLFFDDWGMAWWWLAQATLGAATVAFRPGWTPVRLMILPLVGLYGWVFDTSWHELGLTLGLLGSAVVVLVGLWPGPRRDELPADTAEGAGQWAPALLVFGAVLAGLVAEEHLLVGDRIYAPLLVLGVGALATLRCTLRYEYWRARGTVLAISVALSWATYHLIEGGLFHRATEGGPRLVIAGTCVAVAATAYALLRRLRAGDGSAHRDEQTHDMTGILVALGVVIAVQMLVTHGVFATVTDTPDRWSINVASVSVVGAVATLLGLVLGLRLRREAWRKLALGGLAVVAAKVVFIDLSEVGIAYRVLSFVGLGACLLLGAIAYGRALARSTASDSLPDHNG